MPSYVRKPCIVEAFRYDGDFMNRDGVYYVPEWAQKAEREGLLYFDGPDLLVKTLEGVITVNCGDYIVKGVAGGIYPCKPDVFKQTHGKLD